MKQDSGLMFPGGSPPWNGIEKKVSEPELIPLHLVFDCEIMYAWTGEPDKADLPQTFSVDYFRFWREK